jgi:hypothetical protein
MNEFVLSSVNFLKICSVVIIDDVDAMKVSDGSTLCSRPPCRGLLERRLEEAGNMPAAEIGSKAVVFFRLDEKAVKKTMVVQFL